MLLRHLARALLRSLSSGISDWSMMASTDLRSLISFSPNIPPCFFRAPRLSTEESRDTTLDLCERNNLRSPASAAHVNFLGLFPTWTLYSLTIKITFGCPSHPIPLVAPRCNVHLRWCHISTAEQCSYRVHSVQRDPIPSHPL